MRNLTVVIVVAALFASTAAVSVKHQHRWTEKVDVLLMHAAEQDNPGPVGALIQVRQGSTDRFASHLVQHGVKATRIAAPDLIAAQLPASMLRSIAADPDVLRVSSDHGTENVQ